MSPTKATKILHDYHTNNNNAYKTLKNNGYSETTAKAKAKDVLDVARKTINRHLQLEETDNKEIARKSFEILGLTAENVAEKLKEIATSKDYTNALKVLSILARDIGINLTDAEQKAPSVNITVEKVDTGNIIEGN